VKHRSLSTLLKLAISLMEDGAYRSTWSLSAWEAVSGNSPVIPDDVRRMDCWYRKPPMFVSLWFTEAIAFLVARPSRMKRMIITTKLREQIDAAMAAEQAAAPKQEA
jgi:hypothetical protein